MGLALGVIPTITVCVANTMVKDHSRLTHVHMWDQTVWPPLCAHTHTLLHTNQSMWLKQVCVIFLNTCKTVVLILCKRVRSVAPTQHNGADTHQVSVVVGAPWQPPAGLRVVTHTRFTCICSENVTKRRKNRYFSFKNYSVNQREGKEKIHLHHLICVLLDSPPPPPTILDSQSTQRQKKKVRK